jgi:hypothetical protein
MAITLDEVGLLRYEAEVGGPVIGVSPCPAGTHSGDSIEEICIYKPLNSFGLKIEWPCLKGFRLNSHKTVKTVLV